MPIRFLCTNCSQLLKIATRKAGTEIVCPKCKRNQHVPPESESLKKSDGEGNRFSFDPRKPSSDSHEPEKDEALDLDSWLNDFWSDNERMREEYLRDNQKKPQIEKNESVPVPFSSQLLDSDEIFEGMEHPPIPQTDNTIDVVPPRLDSASGVEMPEYEGSFSPPIIEIASENIPPVLDFGSFTEEQKPHSPFGDFTPNFPETLQKVEGNLASIEEMLRQEQMEAIQEQMLLPPRLKPETSKTGSGTKLSEKEMMELRFNRELEPDFNVGKLLLRAGIYLLFFLFGLFVGVGLCLYTPFFSGSRPVEAAVSGPEPFIVDAKIVYMTSLGDTIPDKDSIVFLFPVEDTPPHPVPSLGLRPRDRESDSQRNNIEKLTEFGCRFARIDSLGEMIVTLDKPGKYHVLIVSANTRRSSDIPIEEHELKTIEQYVLSPKAIIGSAKYVFKEYDLKDGSSPIEYNFQRSDEDEFLGKR